MTRTMCGGGPLQAAWAPGTLLGRIPDDVAWRLLNIGRPVEFAPGQHIVRAGERTTDVYLLTAGYVKIVTK